MPTCPVCHTKFDAAKVPGGLCPRCLMMGGAGDEGVETQPMQSENWIPPTAEELQAAFTGFEIISLIGRGGMGAVYKARQPSLDRIVALKLLPMLHDAGGVGFVERFKNEARLLAKMNHPGIVHVYDFGELDDGACYFVMEYIDGTDVARMVSSCGKLSPEHAASITADVCAALHYAHEAGIVHRDIKPANILVDRQGQVKVADFGLAKAQNPGLVGITQTHLTMGTPEFLAPESLTAGMMVDHRADLYAVGVMLYNMLTGQIPRGVFLPASKSASTPPAFDQIITKAMQADPEHRYQTAAAIKMDVDKARDAAPIPSETMSRPHPLWIVSAACVVGGFGAWNLLGIGSQPAGQQSTTTIISPPPSPPAAAQVEPPEEDNGEVDIESFFKKLKEANPDMGLLNRASHDDEGAPRLALRREVLYLRLNGLSGLKNIECLRDMGITHLDLRDTAVVDFRPILTRHLKMLYFSNRPEIDTSVLQAQQLEEVFVEGEHPFQLDHIVSPRLRYLDLKNVPINSLAPLAACANLRNLYLVKCPVNDLSPIRNLPLLTLSLQHTRVATLEPLRGMTPLHEVNIYECQVKDFSPLKDVPGLQSLGVDGTVYEGARLREFLNTNAAPVPDASAIASASGVLEKLVRMNPGCGPLTVDGKTSAGEDIVFIAKHGDRWLRLFDQPAIRDLSALAGSEFTHLDLRGTSVRDLSPLQSMPLRTLRFTSTKVLDTSPLRSVKTLAEITIEGPHPVQLGHILSPSLYYLDISEATATSLEPLKDCKTVRMLFLSDSPTADLSPLRNLPLEHVALWAAKPASLEHIRSPQLNSIRVSGVAPEALAPLLSLPKLKHIYCDQREFTPASLAEFLGKPLPR